MVSRPGLELKPTPALLHHRIAQLVASRAIAGIAMERSRGVRDAVATERLPVSRGRAFSPDEINRIIELAQIKTIRQISTVTGRPYVTISNILYKHGVSAVSSFGKPIVNNGRPRTWTPERLLEISNTVSEIGEAETAEKYKITTKLLRSKLKQYQAWQAIEQGADPATSRRAGRIKTSQVSHVSTEERKSNQRIASSNALIGLGFESRDCVAKQLKALGIKVAERSKQISVDRDLVEQVYCLADEVVTYLEALVGSSAWNEQDCGVYTSARDLLSISNTILEESK